MIAALIIGYILLIVFTYGMLEEMEPADAFEVIFKWFCIFIWPFPFILLVVLFVNTLGKNFIKFIDKHI